jgi:hypothetical protein
MPAVTPKPVATKKTSRPKPLPPEKSPDSSTESPTPDSQPPPSQPENSPENAVGPQSTELKPENDAKEKARYNELRKKAMSDPQISALKEKLDSASSDDEQRELSKEYYRALFNKMRKLDGSMKDRIDRMDAATQRRLNRHPPPEE